MGRFQATAIGFGAVVLWASLAYLAVMAAPVPPFQLTAMSFTICAVTSLSVHLLRRRRVSSAFSLPPVLWSIGVIGLLGFHAGFFAGLRLAPPAEAGLIAGSWPLLLVLGSALLPGELLRSGHVVGVVIALAGAVVLVAGQSELEFSTEHLWGYGIALLAGCCWAGYSLGQRLFGDVSTETVIGLCTGTAFLAWCLHLLFEIWVMPTNAQLLAILGLGLGPVGGAFFLWDLGCKHGDIQLLGTLSYGEALFSTLILVFTGISLLTTSLIIGAVLITSGSLIAAFASAGREAKS